MKIISEFNSETYNLYDTGRYWISRKISAFPVGFRTSKGYHLQKICKYLMKYEDM